MAENHHPTRRNSRAFPPGLDNWGTAGNLTHAQQEALEQFSTLASPNDLEIAKFKVESIENVSLRFLRARNFHVSNGIQLLRDCVKKKIEGQSSKYANLEPDVCAKCDLNALKKFYPHGQFGYDKFNRPLLFEWNGAVDGHAIHQMTNTENLIAYHFHSMENSLNKMFEIAKEQGPLVVSTCVVLDLSGLSTHHASPSVLDHVKALVALDNVVYPEILGKMFVVNAPWLATTLWEGVKSWLDIRTQQKIEILGSGPEVWSRLLEFIPEDHLPIQYGGKAPNLFAPFKTRENTEFVHIPRSGHITKHIKIPSNKKLILENYITDGEIGLEIYQKISGRTVLHTSTSHANHPHESISYSEWNKFITQNTKTTNNLLLLVKRDLKNTLENPSHYPLKVNVELLADDNGEEMTEYIVSWYNPAMFFTRPLVFNVVIKDNNSTNQSESISPSTYSNTCTSSSSQSSVSSVTTTTSTEIDTEKHNDSREVVHPEQVEVNT